MRQQVAVGDFPKNLVVTIPFNLNTNTDAELTVYSSDGRQITTLFDKLAKRGHYQVQWNAANLPTGQYLVSLEGGDKVSVQQVTLIR